MTDNTSGTVANPQTSQWFVPNLLGHPFIGLEVMLTGWVDAFHMLLSNLTLVYPVILYMLVMSWVLGTLVALHAEPSAFWLTVGFSLLLTVMVFAGLMAMVVSATCAIPNRPALLGKLCALLQGQVTTSKSPVEDTAKDMFVRQGSTVGKPFPRAGFPLVNEQWRRFKYFIPGVGQYFIPFLLGTALYVLLFAGLLYGFVELNILNPNDPAFTRPMPEGELTGAEVAALMNGMMTQLQNGIVWLALQGVILWVSFWWLPSLLVMGSSRLPELDLNQDQTLDERSDLHSGVGNGSSVVEQNQNAHTDVDEWVVLNAKLKAYQAKKRQQEAREQACNSDSEQDTPLLDVVGWRRSLLKGAEIYLKNPLWLSVAGMFYFACSALLMVGWVTTMVLGVWLVPMVLQLGFVLFQVMTAVFLCRYTGYVLLRDVVIRENAFNTPLRPSSQSTQVVHS